MNKLSNEERVRVVACLVEGNSLRATVRMTGIHRTTILKLLVELGEACAAYQAKTLVNLPCKRIQYDEIRSFVGSKEKNTSDEKKAEGWGDAWTWVALDADTKLVPCWFVGPRDAGAAQWFIHDLSNRNRARRAALFTPWLTRGFRSGKLPRPSASNSLCRPGPSPKRRRPVTSAPWPRGSPATVRRLAPGPERASAGCRRNPV